MCDYKFLHMHKFIILKYNLALTSPWGYHNHGAVFDCSKKFTKLCILKLILFLPWILILQLHLLLTATTYQLSFHCLPLFYYHSCFAYHDNLTHFIISSFLILHFSIQFDPSPDNTTPSLFLYRLSQLFFQNIQSIYLWHVPQVLSSH